MPVNADLLKEIPDATAQQPAAQASSAATTSDPENLLDQIPEDNAVAPVSAPEQAATPAPTKQLPTSLHSVTTGFPNNASDANLRDGNAIAKLYLGKDFAQPAAADKQPAQSQAKPVNPETIQKARNDFGKEIAASGNYIGTDFKGLVNTAPQEVKTLLKSLGADPDAFIKQVVATDTGHKALQTYYEARLNLLNSQWAQENSALIQQTPLKAVDLGQGAAQAEVNPVLTEQLKAVDDKYKKQIDQFTQAAFGVAAQKAVNEKLKSGSEVEHIDPYEVGASIRKMMGNEAIMDKATERWHKYGQLDPNEKVTTEETGYRAMQYMQQVAFANNDDKLAQQLGEKTANYQQKILDNNPEFKKMQVASALSRQIYKDQNALYRSITGYSADEEDISKAAKELGIKPEDIQGVTPADIVTQHNILNRAAGSLLKSTSVAGADIVNGIFGDAVREGIKVDPDAKSLPEWWDNTAVGKMLGSQSAQLAPLFVGHGNINTDPKSKDYLFSVTNPDAGKFNTDVGAISNVIADGIGGIAGLALGAGETTKAIQAIDLIKSASVADRVGLGTYVYMTSMNDSYRAAKAAIGDAPEDEAKRLALANIYSVTQAIGAQALPVNKVMGRLTGKAGSDILVSLAAGTPEAKIITDIIKKDGIEGLSKKMLNDYGSKVLDIATSSAKDLGIYATQPFINAGGAALGDMILAPKKYEETDYWTEAKQQAISGTLAGLVPIVGGRINEARTLSPLYKKAVYEVGTNPQTYIDEVNRQLSEKSITSLEADNKIGTIGRMADIVSKEVPVTSSVNGQPLTEEQKHDYATNLIQEQNAELHKKSISDPVQQGIIDDQVKVLQKEREIILTEAGPTYQKQLQELNDARASELKQNEDFYNDPDIIAGYNDNPTGLSDHKASEIRAINYKYDRKLEFLSSQYKTIENGQSSQETEAPQGRQEDVLANNTGSADAQPAEPSIVFEEEPDFMGDRAKAPDEVLDNEKTTDNATTNSNREGQESPTQSSVGEHIGTGERQQPESAGAATPPEADNSNSDTRSNGQEQTAQEEVVRNAASAIVPAGQVGENIKQKFEDAPKEEGHNATRTLANGDKMKGKYVLTTAEAMTPSHDAHTFASSEGFPMLEGDRNPNDRDYENDPNNRATVIDHANNYTGEAVQNTPTVDKNGIVIDGNNRTMSGLLAAEQGTDGHYLEALKDNAHMYGFTPEKVQEMIDAGQHPRLIFVPDEVKPYDTSTFALFNKKNEKPKSALEEAIEMRRTLPADFGEKVAGLMHEHDSMADFYADTNASTSALKMLEEAGVITNTNRKRFFDSENGKFTDEGKKLLGNIMMSQVLDETALRTIQNHDHVFNAVAKAVKNILTLDRLLPGDAMSPTVSAAVKLYDAVQKHIDVISPTKRGDKKAALLSYLSQVPMFSTGDGSEKASVVRMYEMLSEKSNTFLNKEMAKMVAMAEEGTKSATDIFGNGPKDKHELINIANNAADEFKQSGPIEENAVQPNDGNIEPGTDKGNDNATAPIDNSAEQAKETPDTGEQPAGAELGSISEGVDVHGDIYDRIQAATDEVNKYKDFVNKKEDKMAELSSQGKDNSLEYKQQYEAWKKYREEGRAAMKKLQAVTKEHAKAQADIIRKKYKIKGNEDGTLLSATPLAAGAKAVEVVGRTLYNAAIEVIAQAHENLPNWELAIKEGIKYINDRWFTPWPEKEFMDMMMKETPSSKADILKLKDDAIKLSPANKEAADILIQQVKDNKKTLASAIDHVNQSGLSDHTKTRIVKYLNREVTGMHKDTGDALADKHLNNSMGDYGLALKDLAHETDTRLLGADGDTERENIRREDANAKATLLVGKMEQDIKDGKIEQKYKPDEKPDKENTFEVAPDKKKFGINLSKLQQYTQDEMARLQRFQEGAKHKDDVVRNMRLSVPKAQHVIAQIKEKLFNKTDGFFPRLHKEGIDVHALDKFMYALHAPERNKYNAEWRRELVDAKVRQLTNDLANEPNADKKVKMQDELDNILKGKNPEYALMPDGGSGMTTEEANKIVDEMKADGSYDKYKSFADEYRNVVIDPILEFKKDANIISDIDYNHLRNFYDNYVPLKVDMESEGFAGGSPEEQPRRKSIKNLFKSKGSLEYTAEDRKSPIVQSLHDLEQSVYAAEDNKAKQSLGEMIDKHPHEGWETKPAQMEIVRNSKGDIIRQTPTEVPKDWVPYYDENNKLRYAVFHDPGLQNVFKRVQKGIGQGTAVRFLNGITRYFAGVQTVFNPYFIVKNPIIDYKDASMSLYAQDKGYAKDFVTSPGRALWKLLTLRGKDFKEWREWGQDLNKHGGNVSLTAHLSLENTGKEILNAYEHGNAGVIKKTYHKVVEGLESVSTAFERVNRVQAYRTVVEVDAKRIAEKNDIPYDEALKLVDRDKAANISRNVTVDFAKKGVYSPYISAFKTFANASTQGQAGLGFLVLNKKTQHRALQFIALSAGYGFAEAMANTALNGQPDDKEDDYWEQPDYVLSRKSLVPLSVFGGHGYLQMPAGRAYGLFPYIGKLAAGVMLGKVDASEAAMKVLTNTFGYYNPVGGDSPIEQQVAGNFAPFVQFGTNKNAFGSPLRPDDDRALTDHTNYFPGTKPELAAISKWMAETTGGSNSEKGLVDVTPSTLDLMMQSAGGGLWQMAHDMGMTGYNLANGEPVKEREIPLVNQFGKPSNMSQTKSKVRQMMEDSKHELFDKEKQDELKQHLNDLLEAGQISKDSWGRQFRYAERNQTDYRNRVKAAEAGGESSGAGAGAKFTPSSSNNAGGFAPHK
jgi:hypothetical protein